MSAPGRSQALIPTCAARRQAGLDRLKAWVTLLVVFHHTAITYGASGSWFHIERRPDGSLSSTLLLVFCTVNQAWFMGLFFLIAGRFTPPAIDRNGTGGFLRDRALRLGVPWLVFGLVIGPATMALAQTARGQPFVDSLWRLWARGVFEPGPLWFVQALLLFSVMALVWRRVMGPPAGAPALPSDVTLAVAALLTGAAAFALRLAWPVGVTVAHLQLAYFASYGLLFIAGCRAADGGWFEALDAPRARRWRRLALLALPTLLPLALLPAAPSDLGAGVPPDAWAALRAPPTGGWNLPSLLYALWEPWVAWGILMTLLVRARRPASPPGSNGWRQALVRRAYGIYVLHPPVVVGTSLVLAGVTLPPLMKFALVGALSCALAYVVVGVVLRVPGVSRVL